MSYDPRDPRRLHQRRGLKRHHALAFGRLETKLPVGEKLPEEIGSLQKISPSQNAGLYRQGNIFWGLVLGIDSWHLTTAAPWVVSSLISVSCEIGHVASRFLNIMNTQKLLDQVVDLLRRTKRTSTLPTHHVQETHVPETSPMLQCSIQLHI